MSIYVQVYQKTPFGVGLLFMSMLYSVHTVHAAGVVQDAGGAPRLVSAAGGHPCVQHARPRLQL